MHDHVRKLLRNIDAPLKLAARFAMRLARVRLGKRFSKEDMVRVLDAREYPPGQWKRWYKTNKKRQRQLRALKQRRGGPINPNITGLPRSYVP